MKVIYLVLVFIAHNPGYSPALSSVTIPQANMEQCLTNLRNHSNGTYKATCIVGVK